MEVFPKLLGILSISGEKSVILLKSLEKIEIEFLERSEFGSIAGYR
jgi:hypothetical protein